MTRFGIIGSAIVGQTLAKGLKKHGYEVRIASRTPSKLHQFGAEHDLATGTFAEVAAWAEAIVLAVPGRSAAEALTQAGAAGVKGKLVIDATNPISAEPPEDGVLRFFTSPNLSLMETLQADFAEAKFVKAFSSVGAGLMVDPALSGGRPTMFYCGDDAEAKAAVARIIDQFGWEGADMGTAKAARAIEPLCQLWCIPGFRQNDWAHAFKVLRP